jgi:polyhydroxyalkanoate synthase subunit PhaC
MTTPQDNLPPGMQPFLQAGQAMAEGFMQYLSKQGPNVFSGLATGPVNLTALPPPNLNALRDMQNRYLELHGKLWSSMLEAQKPQGNPQVAFRVEAEPGDRRFAAPEWRESPLFDYMQQAYLLNARMVRELVEAVPTEDGKTKERLRFLARQYANAMAPSNFAATNPEFINTALATNGQSITDGIANLIADVEKGRISMTDETVFEVGQNIATSQGSVVFENEIFQLLQYAPLTEKVGQVPLLIVPPCINKFYILDLQPENSLVRFAVEQGNTVFLVSWRNPKAEQGHLSWDDYVDQAAIKAIEVVREIAKVEQINALGFCVGGTILSSALGVLKVRGQEPVQSLTLLTTLLDFSDPGEIGLFIDDNGVRLREETIGKGGLLTGRELATTFSALRSNDLIWNYVANNYLKGKKPQAFDLLYWNSDSTNLPGPFAAWYMRNMYLENNLRVPGKLKMCGVPVDLSQLKMPAYLLATREDHIVPWQSAYLSTRVLGGQTKFVLGASGHIAGVVNPASKNKRSYWTGGDQQADAAGWLGSAQEIKGSWWNDWAVWLTERQGPLKAAPKKAGSVRFPAIEPAPGRYVKEKA